MANTFKKQRKKTYIYGESLNDITVGDYIIFGQYPYSKKRKATLTPYAKTKEYIDPLAIEYIDYHIYNYLLRNNSSHKISK